MKHLDLTIVSDQQRKIVRKRRRRTLALALVLAAVAGLGQWQLRVEEEGLASSLTSAALLEAVSLAPREAHARTGGITVAEYAARRRSFLGREPQRPLGARPLGASAGPSFEEASLSPEERAAVFSAPLLPR